MASITKTTRAMKRDAAKKSTGIKVNPTTKLAKLKQHWAAGEYRDVLKLASGWQRLGGHKEAIQIAWAAMTNPATYRDMGKDPDELIATGISAIADRYKLPPASGVIKVDLEPKPTPKKNDAPKVPGVRPMRTRPYLAGQIIAKHGLAAGVTEGMVAELDKEYGKANPTESMFCLKNAWHSCRAFAGAGESAVS